MKSFAVCTDVKLGPLLPLVGVTGVNKAMQIDHNVFRQKWEKVEKNLTSTDPNKTIKGTYTRDILPLGDGPPTNRKKVRKPSSVEAFSTFDMEGRLKNCVPVFHEFDSINLFAQAVHVAFYEHYPLRLGPDVIWLTILQGLAKHIDQDPEGQRKNFVNFEGKQTLVVCRPQFIKGSPDNDWTTVFPEFAEMLETYVGKEKASTMTCDFTTSTPTDRVCSHIALMDTVKHYFNYEMLCGCGIPSIELGGTIHDWVSLREKAGFLCQFHDLKWWTKELFQVLDHFVEAAKGNPDIKFWKSVCNLHGGSGFWSQYVTGWVQVFFPYTNAGHRCNWLGEWRNNYESGTGRETEDYNRGVMPIHPLGNRDQAGYGLNLDCIPVGVSQAPFKYSDTPSGHNFDMTFNGGIVAIFQDKETRALEPVTGWAVLDHGMITN
jgi:hypothetical protein